MNHKKQQVIIRAIHSQDLPDINKLRRMKGVSEYITGTVSERLEQTEGWFKSLSSNNHLLVAEIELEGKKQVIGVVDLSIKAMPRLRHVGGIGIMVHTDFQNQGIGRRLMEEVLDLADNWLNLVRVELTVLTNNKNAIRLYESLDFVTEGTLKYAHSFQGAYVDVFTMARYRVNQ